MNKTFFFITNILAVLFVIIAANLAHIKIVNLNKEVDRLNANNKGYLEELDSLNHRNLELRLTIDELNYSKDSILNKLVEEKDKLKIKDKNIKYLQYLLSSTKIVDTIKIRDTLFKDPELNLDTTIGDKWHNVRFTLKYPNIITSDFSCISEKYIIMHSKKETVYPPKKFFIKRWFQKKHRVVEVEIVEKNPHINNINNKFVEIVN